MIQIKKSVMTGKEKKANRKIIYGFLSIAFLFFVLYIAIQPIYKYHKIKKHPQDVDLRKASELPLIIAMRIYRNAGKEKAMPYIANRIEKSSNPNEQQTLLIFVSHYGWDGIVEMAKPLLKSNDMECRIEAAKAIFKADETIFQDIRYVINSLNNKEIEHITDRDTIVKIYNAKKPWSEFRKNLYWTNGKLAMKNEN